MSKKIIISSELLKEMQEELMEFQQYAETEVCSSIRIEAKDMARGYTKALYKIITKGTIINEGE